MASSSIDSICFHGESKAQMLFGKILDTISVAAAPDSPDKQRRLHPDKEIGEIFSARSVEKRGLLNIDLNVAPPEDGGSESPAAENGQEIRPTAVADISEEIDDEVYPMNSEKRDEIQAHWSKGETIGFEENKNTVTDTENERGEKEMKNRLWNALLDAAENALIDYEENVGNKEVKVQNRKRRTSREVELGGELHKLTNRKKINGHRWNEAAETAELLAPPPVVARSTRGRAVAMPNKYKDSVLHAAAEAAAGFSRHNRSGKNGAVVSTKRKFR